MQKEGEFGNVIAFNRKFKNPFKGMDRCCRPISLKIY
jgi:hypothetical protein